MWEYDEPDADVPALDTAAARVWKLWLIPSLFDGFDPSEWQLSADDTAAVREQVSRYREVCEHVHGTGTEPTAADITPARKAVHLVYRKVLGFLFVPHPYSPELIALLRDCRRIALDPSDPGVRRWVVAVDQSLDFNWDGERTIEVKLVIPDPAPDDDSFWADWRTLEVRLKDKLWERAEAQRSVVLSATTESELLERITGVPA